jgi:hypothetical protein
MGGGNFQPLSKQRIKSIKRFNFPNILYWEKYCRVKIHVFIRVKKKINFNNQPKLFTETTQDLFFSGLGINCNQEHFSSKNTTNS